MDDLWYNDLKQPFNTADQAAVTLSTTNKALVPAANLPTLPANYFDRVGKKLRIDLFGKITTAATPGNGTLALLAGTGADANGVSVVASAAQTLIAAQTDVPWQVSFVLHCRSVGIAGTLFCVGWAQFGIVVVAAGTFLIPASAPVVSGAINLTQPLVLSPQFLRSGSTVELMTVQDVSFIALN